MYKCKNLKIQHKFILQKLFRQDSEIILTLNDWIRNFSWYDSDCNYTQRIGFLLLVKLNGIQLYYIFFLCFGTNWISVFLNKRTTFDTIISCLIIWQETHIYFPCATNNGLCNLSRQPVPATSCQGLVRLPTSCPCLINLI